MKWFLQLSENWIKLYLSLQRWFLWRIESHLKLERHRRPRPLEDDSKRTERRTRDEVMETVHMSSPSFYCTGHKLMFNMDPHWPAGSPILPRGTKDFIWNTTEQSEDDRFTSDRWCYCLYLSVRCTLLITFSGTLSVIGVDMKPGSTQLHRIPNLKNQRRNSFYLMSYTYY